MGLSDLRHTIYSYSPLSSVDCESNARPYEEYVTVVEYFRLLDHVYKLLEITSIDNWDDDQGVVIPASVYSRVITFIEMFLRLHPQGPLPNVNSCGDGFVHVSWTSPQGNRLLIEMNEYKIFRTVIYIRSDECIPEEINDVSALLINISEFLDVS